MDAGRDQYLIYVHFDPIHRDHRGDQMRMLGAKTIAEKLIQLDDRLFPGIMGRLNIIAPLVTEDVDSFRGPVYDLEAGITVWIERSPQWSLLRHPIQRQFRLMMMRSEVRRQLELP
jgi:hypothetical protein